LEEPATPPLQDMRVLSF